MQVILLDKMPNLGNLGDVVRVKDGYARNYLIPYGKARRATQEAIADFETRRAELEKAASEKLSAAQQLAGKLEGLRIELVEKAAVDGRLFGSVNNQAVANHVNEKGFELTRANVVMPDGAIKIAGEHEVTISLHPDVQVTVTVVVAGDTA